LGSIHCFDAVGWETGRTLYLACEVTCASIPKGSVQNTCMTKIGSNWLTYIHLENGRSNAVWGALNLLFTDLMIKLVQY